MGFYGILLKEVKVCVEIWLKKLDLWEKCMYLICELLGGMKCWVMIVWVLMYNLKLLILDEFIVGVDIEFCCLLWDFLWEFN